MKLKKWMTKLSAMLLAFALCVTLLPSIANASDEFHMVHYGVYSGMGEISGCNNIVNQDSKGSGVITDSSIVGWDSYEIVLYPVTAGEGYQFSRWVDQNGNTITTESTVTFTAYKDHDYYYYAVFEKISGPVEYVKLKANTLCTTHPSLKCGYIKVDDIGGHYNLDTEREKDTEVTLKAVALDGFNFEYWKDTATDKILSYDTDYKVTLDSDIDVTAVFSPIEAKEMTIQIISKDTNGHKIDGAVSTTGEDGSYKSELTYTALAGDFSYIYAKDTENYKFLYYYNAKLGKTLIHASDYSYQFVNTDNNSVIWAVYEEKTPAESDEEEIITPSDESKEDETVEPSEDETVAPSEDETVAPSEDETVAPSEDETVAPSEDETVAPVEESKEDETVAPVEESKEDETVAPVEESSETTTAAAEETTAAAVADKTNPDTGDSNFAVWFNLILMLCAVVIGGAFVVRRKRN